MSQPEVILSGQPSVRAGAAPLKKAAAVRRRQQPKPENSVLSHPAQGAAPHGLVEAASDWRAWKYFNPAPQALVPEDVEFKLLLEAIFLQSGLELRNYAQGVLKERVLLQVQAEGLRSVSDLQAQVLRDAGAFERLMLALTGRCTGFFNKPARYRVFRREVVPWLRTFPFVRLWLPGCAEGAEAYSLAIVLLEEGLQDRCRLYATDLHDAILREARAGRWPIAALEAGARNYRKAGGRRSFAQYCQAEAEEIRMSPVLQKNIVWAAYNPVTDASFNEFHVIWCREAMSDYDVILQAQMHDLFYGSLMPRGFLVLDSSADLQVTLHATDYEPLNARHGIYRKKWFT